MKSLFDAAEKNQRAWFLQTQFDAYLWKTRDSNGDDSLHPTQAGSIKIAGLLVTALRPILN